MRGRSGRRARVALAAFLAATPILSACVPAPRPPVTDPGSSTVLLPLHVARGADAALVDSAGRQVVLRGANFNQLGDYFVTDPRLPTVAALDESDWADAQALGFSVVRLVTTWSAWEPERGRYDEAYTQRIADAVAAANAHGMYVIVDLHQDAWSKFVYAPPDHVCPAGWQRTRGWDGAPSWVTFTDGAETCSPDGKRESSPAVVAAWDAFYANRDGIRDAYAELWGHIAGRFAGMAGVAGFDLLNEPGQGSSSDGTVVGLAAAYRQAIAAIRSAERAVAPAAPPHAVLFEGVGGATPLVGFDLSDDPGLVFAPHTYSESFNDEPGQLDLSLDGYLLASQMYGTPVFLGEYGAYRSADFNQTWTSRVHRLVDAARYAGDTWWQWEQSCGDPHNTYFPMPEDEVLRRIPSCADSRSPQACPTRPYPRAVPGRLTELVAEPCGSGPLTVTGRTPTPSTADLWFPAPAGSSVPVVDGTGIVADADAVIVRPVPGGFRVFVRVAGDYRIRVEAA